MLRIAKSKILNNQTILLYTRFFEFKIERVLEVLRRVVEQIPEAKLVVVGKGFNGEEDRLLAQAEAIGLRGSIEYAGWVDAAALPEYFTQASVAIYPFDDTLINRTKCSVKLIDLLSAGVPVVADAVGQNAEYIRHNETGMLVASGDVEAMAQAVIDLLRDREKADRLGAASRAGHDRAVQLGSLGARCRANLWSDGVRKFAKWWLPVIVWMGVIFIGSSIGNVPRVGGTTLDGLVHRAAHVLEFAILGALCCVREQGKPITKREMIMTLIVVALYGASDEFHQRFTPGRSSEGLSVLFDVAGGAMWRCGPISWWNQQRRANRRS